MPMNERNFDFVYLFEILKSVIFDKWNTKDFRKGIVLNETSSSFLYYLNNIPPYVQAEMQYIQHKANKYEFYQVFSILH